MERAQGDLVIYLLYHKLMVELRLELRTESKVFVSMAVVLSSFSSGAEQKQLVGLKKKCINYHHLPSLKCWQRQCPPRGCLNQVLTRAQMICIWMAGNGWRLLTKMLMCPTLWAWGEWGKRGSRVPHCVQLLESSTTPLRRKWKQKRVQGKSIILCSSSNVSYLLPRVVIYPLPVNQLKSHTSPFCSQGPGLPLSGFTMVRWFLPSLHRLQVTTELEEDF